MPSKFHLSPDPLRAPRANLSVARSSPCRSVPQIYSDLSGAVAQALELILGPGPGKKGKMKGMAIVFSLFLDAHSICSKPKKVIRWRSSSRDMPNSCQWL